MTLNATINSQIVKLKEQSVKRAKTLDGRSTLQFTVEDPTGATRYVPGQVVVLTDTIRGDRFEGFLLSADETNLYPNPNNEVTITIGDNIYLADKRYYSGVEFTNRFAGDIATEMVQAVLADEGIKATYAVDKNASQADFGRGILTNVVATSNNGGDLELAPSGADYNGFIAAQTIPTFSALKYTGTCAQGYGNAYAYTVIYNSSTNYTIASGDILQYDVWIQSDSPEIKAGVDIVFTDGSNIRDSTDVGKDYQYLGSHPNTDLAGYANDQWYTRLFLMGNSIVGKKIAYVTIAFEGESNGVYTAYFRRMMIQNNNVSKVAIFSDTSTIPQTSSLLSDSGYSGLSVSVVAAHDKKYNTFYSYDLSSVQVVRSSIVTWDTSSLPSGAVYLQQTSTDVGASRQVNTNGGAIPNLLPGGNVNGRSIFFWQYVTQGIDPTLANTVPAARFTIYTAPVNSLSGSDVFADYDLNSQWDTGTYHNAKSGGQSNLQMDGVTESFATASDVGANSWFGNGSPYAAIQQGKYGLQCNATSEARVQLTSPGTVSTSQGFTIELEIQVKTQILAGFTFMTTTQTNTDSYAYAIELTPTSISLIHGANGGAGSNVTLGTKTISLSDASWHRVRLTFNGTYSVYLDNIWMFDANDASPWSGPGYICLRNRNTSSSVYTLFFKNFGLLHAIVNPTTGALGYWTSPAISLSSAQHAGASYLTWDDSQSPTDGLTYTPSGTTLTVQTTVNGGSTWLTATNGGPIPGITPGQSLSGISLQIKILMTVTSASVFPTVGGISIWQAPQYQSNGSRVSPALYLGDVGRAGSTLVSWSGTQPANTSINVDTSLDDFTFTQIGTGATNYASIAGISTQPDPYLDDFNVDSSRFYLNIARAGGSAATWSQSNGTMTASGTTGGLYLYNALTALDADVSSVMDSTCNAGFVLRYVDAGNFYYCLINDSAASSNPNTVRLMQYVGGASSTLATQAISFTHGTPHVFTFSIMSGVMTFIMDGITITTYSPASPLGAGLTGLYCDSGPATFYIFRNQGYGDDLSNKEVFTRVRLSTTDPTAAPVLTELSTTVRNPNIQSGAFIPATQYSVLSGSKNTLSQDFDDAAKQSNYGWWIDDDGEYYFQGRVATLAPWPLTGADVLLSSIKVTNSDDNYRDSQWATGGVDTLPRSESFLGDGNATTFTTGYPISSVTGLSVNGNPLKFGIKGLDVGKDWYYEYGSSTLTQDSAGTPYNKFQSLSVDYDGLVPITTNVRRDDSITERSAIDGTSGIIEVAEDASGLNKAALISLADSRLTQFCTSARALEITTLRDGLEPGQLLPVFLTMHGFTGDLLLITEVDTSYTTVLDPDTNQTALQPWYDVKLTEGAIVGDWSKFFLNLARYS